MRSKGFSRREVLTIGALGLGGLALPDLLRAESASGVRSSKKAIIMIYMCGAPPHQDMYDLKMDAPAEIRGEFQPIDTNVPGIRICEHLPRLARIMDKLVPIRTVVVRPTAVTIRSSVTPVAHSYSPPAAGRRGERRSRNC
ncbi:DUF1501 domain-containing protein [Anatilimnocola aggregata]|uniref:DUF1501 domain-containing protein n=1 Tax=Anatilimnocola aggregata TaxID=2528021 RepID=UPI0021BC558C|nr:DUF1501 domain-containing protein [Anatilimnocola aggregata]